MLKKKHYDYDLIVIGSGSGGSVGAHYSASLGKKVAIFECEAIGGECPNFACVPTKALIHAANTYQAIKDGPMFGIKAEHVTYSYPKIKSWKDLVVSRTGAAHGKEAFQKDNIHVHHAKARFISQHEVEANGKIYSASKFLIATGSKVFIPPIPGLSDVGYITSKQAVDFSKLPSSILIFGGGAIGCEFSHIFSTLGSKVILVNRSERILSKEDTEVSGLVQALFTNAGISVLTNTSIEKVEKRGKKKAVWLRNGKESYMKEVDEIMIATGKVPELDFNPEKAGIKIVDHRLSVSKYLQTNVHHIFAAGDVVGPYLFTHTGYYQSYIAAHNMFSHNPILPDYTAVPRAIFIHPEVASVGMSEEDAIKSGIKIRKGITAIAVVGRANTSNELDGFVKVITNEKGVIIGGSIIAPSAGEMIHELTLAITLKTKASVLADMMHAYPTFSEAIKIACSLVE
jgi:pyruvate/2-oxoglutarate dehydrogenase complex dihydrolipoamide dehydrogenase (E3) component